MKLFAALLVLVVVPVLAAARPANMSQPETVNRASAHDRHHHRHASVHHKHHTVPKHHPQAH